MIRLATWPVANRIIGRPSRRLASFGGGLPMMRLSQQTVVYRIIGMPSRRFLIGTYDTCASSAGLLNHFFRPRGAEGHANDAQSTPGSALAHHWHAFGWLAAIFLQREAC